MGRTALITRTEPGASSTALAVRARGWEPVMAPLLEAVFRRDWFDPATDFAAIALTSANGARALTESVVDRMVPVFTVGDATAEAARAGGFRHVFSADGDVAALADLIVDVADGDEGRVLHVAGAHVAGDLVGLLAERGIEAERVIAYSAEACRVWPTGLPGAAPRAVLFHSPRAAEAFAALQGRDPRWPLSETWAVGISAAAVGPVEALGWAGVVAAGHPSEAALLDALDGIDG